MKPRVLLINGSIYLPGEGGYKRTRYLFNMMKEQGYDVTLLTSDFNHYAKKQRDVQKFRQEYPECKDIEMIHVAPYTKNISIKRWYSGKMWYRGATRWVKEHYHNFDIVYGCMPDDTIKRIDGFCHKNGLKIVVDIRDLWPEVFRVLLKKEWIYRIITYPMKRRVNSCYAAADELVAVSNEYLQRGLQVNTKSKNPLAVYIGAIFDKFYKGVEEFAPYIDKKEGETWVSYAGTLGSTYDLYTLMDAAEAIQKTGRDHIIFKIIGQGPECENLKQYVANKNIGNVDFVGFVEYEKMAAYLSKSDMTINSVKRRASQSIINKVADYFAAGVPCLNGSSCQEMRDLIVDYQAGLNFEPEDVDSLVNAILKMDSEKELAVLFGNNAKRLAKEKFDRSVTYPQIIRLLDSLME